jgi:MFS family permease
VIGRLTGPLIGGAIVSFASWHWIFFVNIPFGILAIALALVLIDEDAERLAPARFDLAGFLLIAVGLAALLGALEAGSKGMLPLWVSLSAGGLGVAALGAYVTRSRRLADSLIDLAILRFHTFRTNVIGAVPLRLALSAVPFLLPLMLQLGYGLSPMAAGLVAAASAFGALCTRGVMRMAIERFGFRRLLLGATLVTGLLYASLALYNPVNSPVLLGVSVFCSGLTSSLCMILLNTLGFVEIPKDRTSHATTLTTMAQQLLQGGGVVLAVMLLGAASWLRHGSGEHQEALDYAAGLLAAGLLPLLSLRPFASLRPDVGAELRAEPR